MKDSYVGSPEQLISRKQCNKNIKSMTDELQKIKITQTEHGKDISYIKENVGKITNFIENADEKYADKERTREELTAQKKHVDKIFWTALASLLGFLGWILKSFITYMIQNI